MIYPSFNLLTYIGIQVLIIMLNKSTQGAKKARPGRKHQLAFLIMHSNKKGDIWWRPRPKLLYISEGSVSQSANAILMYLLNIRTCMVYEHISYELNFDVQQFEHN